MPSKQDIMETYGALKYSESENSWTMRVNRSRVYFVYYHNMLSMYSSVRRMMLTAVDTIEKYRAK